MIWSPDGQSSPTNASIQGAPGSKSLKISYEPQRSISWPSRAASLKTSPWQQLWARWSRGAESGTTLPSTSPAKVTAHRLWRRWILQKFLKLWKWKSWRVETCHQWEENPAMAQQSGAEVQPLGSMLENSQAMEELKRKAGWLSLFTRRFHFLVRFLFFMNMGTNLQRNSIVWHADASASTEDNGKRAISLNIFPLKGEKHTEKGNSSTRYLSWHTHTHRHTLYLPLNLTHIQTHTICALHPGLWNRQQREGHQRDNTIGKALQRVMINLCVCVRLSVSMCVCVCVCVCPCPKEKANGFISFCDSNDMEALWFSLQVCVCAHTHTCQRVK